MKQFILKHRKSVFGLAGMLAVGIITMSFQDSPFVEQRMGLQPLPPVLQDTPPQKHFDQARFDKAMLDLQKAMDQLREQLKNADTASLRLAMETIANEIHPEELMASVSAALQSVGLDKVLKEAGKAVQEIDLKQVMEEAASAIKSIDTRALNEDIRKSMDQLQLELKTIDKDELKKELEQLKLELEKSKEELKGQKKTISV